MEALWEAVQLLLTLLLGAGVVDTRQKIKADRRLRQENSDVAALDEAAKTLDTLRQLYLRRRQGRRRFFRQVSDDQLTEATMALDTAVRRVVSGELAPLVVEYNDIAGQYAGRAEEVGVESEKQAYDRLADAIATLRQRSLRP